jgi:response regulator RpfG family c-di-GMP phosphodiesterase
MLPKKYKHRYEALLDDNRVLSEDATGFSKLVKSLQRDTQAFSEQIIAQEEYFNELAESTGLDPFLIEPMEQQLLHTAMALGEFSKALRKSVSNASEVVCKITDNFCALVADGRKLERRMSKADREDLLAHLENRYKRLKVLYFRYKYEVLEQFEALGRLRLLGQLSPN